MQVEALPLTRRERRKQEVRGRITEAALNLFAEQGCDITTVEEICELADVARKTFYNYYPSKQELIRELSQAMLYDETMNLVDLAIEKFPTTRERIQFFCDQMSNNLERSEDLERSLIHQTLVDLSNEDSQAGRQLGMLNESFTRLMEEGRELGDVSSRYSTAFLGEMAIGVINTVVLNWIHKADYPIRQRVGELSEFLCDILVDEGGHS